MYSSIQNHAHKPHRQKCQATSTEERFIKYKSQHNIKKGKWSSLAIAVHCGSEIQQRLKLGQSGGKGKIFWLSGIEKCLRSSSRFPILMRINDAAGQLSLIQRLIHLNQTVVCFHYAGQNTAIILGSDGSDFSPFPIWVLVWFVCNDQVIHNPESAPSVHKVNRTRHAFWLVADILL